MNPTKEQIQWLWEQCGFKELDGKYILPHYKREISQDGLPYNMIIGLPPIDLNNLFKYAVPKLDIERINLYPATKDRWGCYFDDWYQDHNVANTPALALFWAIYKALEGKL